MHLSTALYTLPDEATRDPRKENWTCIRWLNNQTRNVCMLYNFRWPPFRVTQLHPLLLCSSLIWLICIFQSTSNGQDMYKHQLHTTMQYTEILTQLSHKLHVSDSSTVVLSTYVCMSILSVYVEMVVVVC